MTYYGDMISLEDFEQEFGLGEDVEAMEEFREKLYGEDNTCYTAGDTAACRLDSFNWIDYEGWEEYYAGGELPDFEKIGALMDEWYQERK